MREIHLDYNSRPKIGNVYKLTYYGAKTQRGREIVSKDFKYMAKRRSGYYFLSTDGVIDLVVREDDFHS